MKGKSGQKNLGVNENISSDMDIFSLFNFE